MATRASENEIQKLVRFYRKAIRELAREFVSVADFDNPASLVHVQQAFAILNELDNRTARWAKKNVAGLYAAAGRGAQRALRRRGVPVPSAARVRSFAVVNRSAIQALLVDPEVGFVTGLRVATRQIRDRMRTIQTQARLLVRSQRLFDQSIARVGFLEGKVLNEVRDAIVEEMLSLRRSKDLLFTSAATKELQPGHLVRNVAELPFVKIPDRRAAAGFRKLRADKYAELLARTKTAQASNLARRNKALEHDIHLMQISKNKPLHDDACFLYLGKVFALTEDAAAEHGVPMLAELPNGGAPFHPHCTHQELQFVIDFESEVERDRAFIPPPEWALNRPFGEVQKEFVKRGGAGSIKDFNQQATRTTGGRERRRREAEGDES